MKEGSDKSTTRFGKALENKEQDFYNKISLINNVGRNKIQDIDVLKYTAINIVSHIHVLKCTAINMV